MALCIFKYTSIKFVSLYCLHIDEAPDMLWSYKTIFKERIIRSGNFAIYMCVCVCVYIYIESKAIPLQALEAYRVVRC
jgi:hypothetical protein